MTARTTTRTIKTIRIDADKCSGCRLCETLCSAYHAEPKYGMINPRKSRIQVFRDEDNDIYVPIMGGHHVEVECNSRTYLTINGKSYGQCSFCRSSCPSRDLFKDPDHSDIPLTCDACGEPMPEGGPNCVRSCLSDALTFVETEEEIELREEEEEEEIEEL